MSRYKRNYQEEIKNKIIQIVNTNFNPIMDENGQIQPCDLFKALGINLVNEKEVIKREINEICQMENVKKDSSTNLKICGFEQNQQNCVL